MTIPLGFWQMSLCIWIFLFHSCTHPLTKILYVALISEDLVAPLDQEIQQLQHDEWPHMNVPQMLPQVLLCSADMRPEKLLETFLGLWNSHCGLSLYIPPTTASKQ